MLPLLPALILLLLQGPSNVERLAHEGRWPAELGAPTSCRQERVVYATQEQRKVLEHLLAVSSDAQLTRALTQLLTLVIDEPVASLEAPTSCRSEIHAVTVAVFPVAAPPGFVKSQRTRDGPATALGIRR